MTSSTYQLCCSGMYHETPSTESSYSVYSPLSASRIHRAREQLLFGNARVSGDSVEERIEQLREADEALHHQHAHTNPSHDATDQIESISPSLEASKTEALNETGPGSDHRDPTWEGDASEESSRTDSVGDNANGTESNLGNKEHANNDAPSKRRNSFHDRLHQSWAWRN